MIIARLIGGLGNQMFQYACARRAAYVRGARLKLDLSGFKGFGLRRYALGDLNISAEIATEDEVRRFKRRAHVESLLPRWLRKLLRDWRYSELREQSFGFDADVLSVTGNILLEGYWQSEKYFADIADIIRREFTLKASPDSANEALANLIESMSAVSIHVRRGDYVADLDTHRVHGACGLDYYARAVQQIVQNEPHPHFFVFSDDPQWVKEHLRFPFPTVFVEHNGPHRHCEDLWLMSRCRHNIIANSSFSWWGAWLNPNPAKIVIAPSQWFKLETLDTKDLIPEGWVRG